MIQASWSLYGRMAFVPEGQADRARHEVPGTAPGTSCGYDRTVPPASLESLPDLGQQ
jgi:hypothetical protein